MINPFKIGSLFPYRDKLPKHMRASVVYKFCCVQCTSEYIGSTKCALFCRVVQHSGRSFRTNRVLSSPSYSSIRDHTFSCNAPLSINNFTILISCKTENDLHILKSLYIFKTNPKLNSLSSAPTIPMLSTSDSPCGYILSFPLVNSVLTFQYHVTSPFFSLITFSSL